MLRFAWQIDLRFPHKLVREQVRGLGQSKKIDLSKKEQSKKKGNKNNIAN